MISFDVQLLYLLNDLAGKSAVFDKAIIFFANYLQYPLVALFLIGLYFWFAQPQFGTVQTGAGRISKSGKNKILWTALLSVTIARLGVTELIRFFYHRPRPFLAYNDIYPLISKNEYSFPSGHAAFFFALAAAIYFYNNKRWGAWFFIAAIFISLSRVVAGIHYPSDIVAGAIIGIICGYGVHWVVEMRAKKKISN